MNKNYLLTSAKKLQQVSRESAETYSKTRDLLVSRMNEKMEKRPDILELVGTKNIDMMKDNHANHARFMESIFHQHAPEVLVDTVLWVFRAYRSRDFSPTYWSAQLNGWVEIIRAELPEKCYNEIYPYYHWMLINIPVFNQLSEKILEAPASAHH